MTVVTGATKPEAMWRDVEAGSPHLEALVDFMEVAGWVEADSSDAAGYPVRRATARGLKVLREA